MAAYYGGLDVSDQTTAICIIDGKGKVVAEESAPTDPLLIARALKPYGRILRVVAHEAGSKSPWLHKELSRKRVPVVCLDARITAGTLAAQRNKTDRNDARSLANVVRTGWYSSAYMKSDQALTYRALIAHRRAMKRKAQGLELTLRMSIKVFGASITKKAGAISIAWGKRKPDALIAKSTQALLKARSYLLNEVKALDAAILKIAKNDAVCRRLMTVPGVGALTALSFRAAVDDPERFSSSRAVAAYFGLTPRRKQSGKSDVSGRISRMGDVGTRCALYEAATVLMVVSKSKCALRQWALRLREKNGHRRAAVALARKLAVVMHRMWITERDFDGRAPA